MKVLGHHVGRPFILLALADGCLFLAIQRLIQNGQTYPSRWIGYGGHFGVLGDVLLLACFLGVTMSLGLYKSGALQDQQSFIKRSILACLLIFPPVVILTSTLNTPSVPTSPRWMLGMIGVAMAAQMLVFLATRYLLVWRFSPWFMQKRVMVIGDGQRASAISSYIEREGRSHLRNMMTIDIEQTLSLGVGSVGNLAVKEPVASAQSLTEIAQQLRVNEIVVALPDRRGLPLDQLLDCKLKGVNVVDSLTFWEREAGKIDIDNVGAGWLTFEGGFLLDQPRRIVKRAVDFIVSLSFLIAVLPLCLMVALLIKLESRGPIFYRQERVGLNGRIFKVWKFRSMRTDAEKDGPQWAQTGDSRVTRIGGFIRKARIDEIPQIINVLCGDMSFIGPRPERPFFVDQLRAQLPYYDLRHKVRPGITGWAQVNYPYGASIEDAKHKLSYDLYYLKRNDFVLDLVILMQTVHVILFAQGSR